MARVLSLDQTFVHSTITHEYCIKWAHFGHNLSPPLVFIHGTPWSSSEWQELATALSSRFHVFIYDHPGFGVSPSPQRLTNAANQDRIDLDASLVLRAEASAALFKSWNLARPPHVVAHDNGGLVSLRLLLQHENPFASLCLIDVVAFGSHSLPFFKLVAENESIFKAIPANFIEGLLRSYVKSATYKSTSLEIEDMLCAPWVAGGTQGPQKFLNEMIQAHYREVGAIEDEYARVGGLVPTKIIWGKNDAWVPSDTAAKLKDALNAEEVVVIDEAGHLVQYDQPADLAVEVGLWLSRHSKYYS